MVLGGLKCVYVFYSNWYKSKGDLFFFLNERNPGGFVHLHLRTNSINNYTICNEKPWVTGQNVRLLGTNSGPRLGTHPTTLCTVSVYSVLSSPTAFLSCQGNSQLYFLYLCIHLIYFLYICRCWMLTSSLQRIPSTYCCVLAGSVMYFELYWSAKKAIKLMTLHLLLISL